MWVLLFVLTTYKLVDMLIRSTSNQMSLSSRFMLV